MNVRELVFPIGGGDGPGGPDPEAVRQVYGTAFSVGRHLFLTAAHVLESATASHPDVRIGYGWPAGQVFGAVLIRTEINRDLDVALVEAFTEPDEFPVFTPYWKPGLQRLLTPCWSVGFPHALSSQHPGEIVVRSYQGHIVTNTTVAERPARPTGYEVSFQAPIGLSGAPLLSDTRNPVVLGIVSLSRASGAPVLIRREVDKDNGREFVHEIWESTHYGVAIGVDPLLDWKSDILGRTLGEHLSDSALLLSRGPL